MECCGLSCIRLKSPEQLHFVASYSSGVLWFVLHLVEIPRTVTFCCFFFKLRIVVCLALGWNPQKSYILLLLIQVACFGLSCIRLNPKNSYILLLLIQVACCGLFCIRLKSPEPLHFSLLIQLACCGLSCIRLKSPEQLHFVASYSSCVLWFVLHLVEIPRTVTFCRFLFN